METSSTDLYLAGLVRECLAAANYHTYPQTPEEWYAVAERLGVSVQVVPFHIGGACIVEGLLLHEQGTPEQVARYLAHELAESRLRCECEPPYVHPEQDGACHRVAALVEASP